MIHVIATIELHDGKRHEFLKEFVNLVPLVKTEEGCMEYGPAVDLASGIGAQTSMRENVVVVIEKWKNLDALRKHLEAPHMITYRTKVKNLVKKTKLQVLTPVE